MTYTITSLVSQVLLALYVGMTLGIFAVLGLFLVLVGEVYRRSLSVFGSDKPSHLDGNG